MKYVLLGFTFEGRFGTPGTLHMVLFSTHGVKVWEATVEVDSGRYTHLVNTQHVANGVYYLRVHKDGKEQVLKVVKRR